MTPLVVILGLAVVGCSGGTHNGYVEGYESAVDQVRGEIVTKPETKEQIWNRFDNLAAVFSDLKDPNLAQNIRNAYAEELYFNDTFHTLTSRDDVEAYLLETADRVNATTTEFEEIAVSDQSFFLRWKMLIDVEISGENVVMESYGVSQIRFDDQGKIVFHQDFWDNTEGFFRHLPVVGYVLDKTFQRL